MDTDDKVIEAIDKVLNKYHVTNRRIREDLILAMTTGMRDGTTKNIFRLYEENIGAVTPMMAEQLKEAENDYPAEWIPEAFKVALNHNVRKWAYVKKVLEGWMINGYKNGGGNGNNGYRQSSFSTNVVNLPQTSSMCADGLSLKRKAEGGYGHPAFESFLNDYQKHISSCRMCGGAVTAPDVQEEITRLAERLRV